MAGLRAANAVPAGRLLDRAPPPVEILPRHGISPGDSLHTFNCAWSSRDVSSPRQTRNRRVLPPATPAPPQQFIRELSAPSAAHCRAEARVGAASRPPCSGRRPGARRRWPLGACRFTPAHSSRPLQSSPQVNRRHGACWQNLRSDAVFHQLAQLVHHAGGWVLQRAARWGAACWVLQRAGRGRNAAALP